MLESSCVGRFGCVLICLKSYLVIYLFLALAMFPSRIQWLSTFWPTSTVEMIELVKLDKQSLGSSIQPTFLSSNHSQNVSFHYNWISSSHIDASLHEQNINFQQNYNFNEDESIIFNEQFTNVILVISYSLIVFISLFGNLFVCRVMYSNISNTIPGACNLINHVNNHHHYQHQRKTTTDVLILNLAISDLLLTCFNIPINIVRFISTNWPFGSIICTLTPLIQSLSAHCSSITMMVIAFERYRR